MFVISKVDFSGHRTPVAVAETIHLVNKYLKLTYPVLKEAPELFDETGECFVWRKKDEYVDAQWNIIEAIKVPQVI